MTKATSNGKQSEAQAVEPRLCACGCGETPRTKVGLYLQGHDSRHKQRLVKEFDGGSAEAGRELVERGWLSQEVLDLRQAKASTANVEKRDRLRAKLERLNEQIAELEDQREAVRVAMVTAERLI